MLSELEQKISFLLDSFDIIIEFIFDWILEIFTHANLPRGFQLTDLDVASSETRGETSHGY